MDTPLVFDVWADDGPPDLRPAQVTTPARVRGTQVARIVLAVLLGAAAGTGTLTVVDNIASAPARTVGPSNVAPPSTDERKDHGADDGTTQRTGRDDFCHPGAPRC